jgi:hypothetical protein
MKRLLIAGALLLAAAGCKKDGTSSPQVVSVHITPRDQAVPIGGTLQLSAATTDDVGGTQQNVTGSWQSLTPGIATVSSTGLLTGVSAGTARIQVTVRGKTDEATYQVGAAVSDCSPAAAGAVGQAEWKVGVLATTVCLQGGASGAEYLVMPRYTEPSGITFLNLTVASQGVGTAAGFSPDLIPSASFLRSRGDDGLRRDYSTDRRMRDQERELAPLVAGAQAYRSAHAGISRSVASAVPAVGDILPLNTSSSTCSSPSIRYGKVVGVSQHAVVVVDTANPAGGLTDAEYAQFGVTFDTLVYPVDTQNFGIETDIDGNGHVIIFYTRAVNELTPANNSSYTVGFFAPRDLFPKTAQEGFGACATSNYAEMFYMLVADPNGEVNNNKRSKDLINRTTIGTLAHEFQHLISASRRLYVLKVGGGLYSETRWLNEGMSHIAEELTFYHASGLSPRQNITLATLQSSSQIATAFNRYAVENVVRYHEFLVSPDANSPYDANNDGDDLETRASAWAFLRYLADRHGSDQQAIWYNLVNNNKVGFTNLNDVFGVDTNAEMREWQASVYLDDTPAATAAVFQQPSWNFRSVIPALYSIPAFPLVVHSLGSGTSSASLATGAAGYFTGAVAANGVGKVTFTAAGSAAFPANLDVTVVRIK